MKLETQPDPELEVYAEKNYHDADGMHACPISRQIEGESAFNSSESCSRASRSKNVSSENTKRGDKSRNEAQ